MNIRQFLISNVLTVKSYLSIIRFFKRKNEKKFRPVNITYFLELISKNPVKFIQIGANDGQLNDPIYPHIKSAGWKGVLVEPLPTLIEKLKINYAGIVGLVFENVGIADADSQMDFFYLPEQFNEPDWLQQIGTFDRKAIELNLEVLPAMLPHVKSVKIPTISLPTLIKRNKIENLDILIIDAEGFEYKILKQLELLEVIPNYILFEWGCLDTNEYTQLINILTKRQYELFQSGGDILAVKN
ncbi:MAG: FkbM family methyltransferase [Chitinophagaceae bacterium]